MSRFSKGFRVVLVVGAVLLGVVLVVPRIAPLNSGFVIENRTDGGIVVHVGKGGYTFAQVDAHNSATVMVSAHRSDEDPSADWDGSTLPVRVSDSGGEHTVLVPADWNPWHTYTLVWCGAAGCP